MNLTNIKSSEQFNNLGIWDYKNIFIWLLIIISITFAGFKYISHYKNYKDLAANQKFNVLLLGLEQNDNVTVKLHAKDLLTYSDRTPYPRLGGILLAKVLVTENNLTEAESLLNSIIARGNFNDEIWHLANLRLAKILLMQKKLDLAAKAIKQGLKLNKFTAKYQELNGDLLLANNQVIDAHQFYQQAAQNLLQQQIISPWLDLKIKETMMDD